MCVTCVLHARLASCPFCASLFVFVCLLSMQVLGKSDANHMRDTRNIRKDCMCVRCVLHAR